MRIDYLRSIFIVLYSFLRYIFSSAGRMRYEPKPIEPSTAEGYLILRVLGTAP